MAAAAKPPPPSPEDGRRLIAAFVKIAPEHRAALLAIAEAFAAAAASPIRTH